MVLAQRLIWRTLRQVLFIAAVGLGASTATADIVSARYSDETTRYAHGVLGDAIEYGALEMVTDAQETVRIVLPESNVFEDITPRLFDVDHDGHREVIVVESNQSRGARLAIYDQGGLRAATPYIGTRNRWLAPIGAADLDGDGRVEIAYIDRPHLAKTLRIWRFEQDALSEVGSLSGLTNHRIGEDFISGGVRECGDGPELITADAAWRHIVGTTFDGTRLKTRNLGPFKGTVSMDAALACTPG
ncbi:VCBS repeat-containing protein [Shimia sp. R10_1]|uniref:FG-GAP repeat domain-containing protein n=1 Tax=Shimia sp. R10_1 TaxID=2821095 RepID=UPI001ADAAEC8|nr:VCBS repeat-containing protein [Shimia sp. R10_1]MBO9474366.1 VCBS repeat-containing protein [Shimia sp. R10_1]